MQREEEKADGGEDVVHREKRPAEDHHDLPEERCQDGCDGEGKETPQGGEACYDVERITVGCGQHHCGSDRVQRQNDGCKKHTRPGQSHGS